MEKSLKPTNRVGDKGVDSSAVVRGEEPINASFCRQVISLPRPARLSGARLPWRFRVVRSPRSKSRIQLERTGGRPGGKQDRTQKIQSLSIAEDKVQPTPEESWWAQQDATIRPTIESSDSVVFANVSSIGDANETLDPHSRVFR